MKKLFALLLALSLMLTLAACGGGEQVANMDDNKETTANTTDATTDVTIGEKYAIISKVNFPCGYGGIGRRVRLRI